MDALTKEFLKFVLSREGQEIVVKDGFLPLPAKVVEEELARVRFTRAQLQLAGAQLGHQIPAAVGAVQADHVRMGTVTRRRAARVSPGES